MSGDNKTTVWCVSAICAMVTIILIGLLIYSGYKHANPKPAQPVADAHLECTQTTARRVECVVK